MNIRTDQILPLLLALGLALTLVLLISSPAQGASPMSMPNLAPQVAIPETFNLSSLSVSPEVVAADTPATVWFTITNNGSEEDDYMIGVLVDDQMEATVDGSLPPLASQTHQVSLLRNTPGTYVVGVGPLIDSFTVEGPNIQLTSLKTWPKNVGLGDPVDISLLVTNEGGFPGDYDITVKVGNTAVATFTGILPAGKSKPLLVTYRESQPGTHTVSAGGLSDRFIVIPPYVSRIREAPFIVPATTQAVDDLGHTLPITGDQITHDETKEFVIFHFPVALADGRRLIKFHDFVTGIEVVDNELRIPIRDERAREVLRIVGEVIATEGAGNVARVKVKKESLHLLVRERQIDLTLSDPRLGQVAVSADASLLDLPRIAELQIVAKGTLPPEAHASFEQLVRVQGNTIAEAGFVVEFDAQNLVNGIDVGSVTITLKLGRSWVQSQSGGQESIRIIRRAADGTYLALQTSCTGPDSEERYACTAISPEGWSTFALLSLAPDLQQVRFSDLTVTPAVAEPGEAVEITLRASNDGDEAATVTPLMEVNGKAEAAVTVTLQPGQTQNVAFLKAQEQEGTYRIEVAGLSARFEVATSLDSTLLQASDLRVLPKTVLPEKPTSISVQVQNTGQQAGKFNVPLKVNGLLADVQPVALGPGQSRLVNFIVARTQRGKYAIEVLDLKDTFEVAPALTPAVFKVTSLTVDEERTPPAVPVTVTALVSNASEQGGLFLGILQVNGEVEETRQVFVGGLRQTPISFEVARTAPALYQVEVGDQSVRFEVIPGRVSELLITLRPAATELILGDTIRIATSFANLSASAIGQAVEFKVNGRLVERRTVTLGPAAIRTETFAFNPDEPGSYQIDIAGKTVQVQVVNPSGFPWAIVLASTLPELAIGMGILTWYILRRHRAQLSPQ